MRKRPSELFCAMLPDGRNSKSCRKVKSLPYCLAMGAGPTSPLCASEMFLLSSDFLQQCRSFQVWISSYRWNCFELCMNIHIFLIFFQFIFFENFLSPEYSQLEKQCVSKSTWEIWMGRWIGFATYIASFFQNGRDGVFQDIEFLGASIFI